MTSSTRPAERVVRFWIRGVMMIDPGRFAAALQVQS